MSYINAKEARKIRDKKLLEEECERKEKYNIEELKRIEKCRDIMQTFNDDIKNIMKTSNKGYLNNKYIICSKEIKSLGYYFMKT